MSVLEAQQALVDRRSITVLTDDPALATAGWRRRLGALGCEVQLVDDEGLVAARPAEPAVVVLLAAGAKAEHCPAVVTRLRRRSDVPVLVATESGAEREAVQALRNGATTFLPLPYEPERLEEVLAALTRSGGQVSPGQRGLPRQAAAGVAGARPRGRGPVAGPGPVRGPAPWPPGAAAAA
jgi:DNA-binding response OmpR family regulator